MRILLLSLAFLCAGIQLNAQTNSNIVLQINNTTPCPQYFRVLKFDNTTCMATWSNPTLVPPMQTVFDFVPGTSHIEGAQVFDNFSTPSYFMSVQTPAGWNALSVNTACATANTFPQCAAAIDHTCSNQLTEVCWGGDPDIPTIDINF